MSETLHAPPAETGIDARYPASAVPSIKSVRLSPGDVVDLVNISRSGVLVEGRTRFVPGTRVTVLFEGGFAPASVRAKVIRCQVSSVSGGVLRYQSGIQFDARLDAFEPHAPTPPGSPEHAIPGPASPATPVAATAPAPAVRRLVNRW